MKDLPTGQADMTRFAVDAEEGMSMDPDSPDKRQKSRQKRKKPVPIIVDKPIASCYVQDV